MHSYNGKKEFDIRRGPQQQKTGARFFHCGVFHIQDKGKVYREGCG
jgi:hypothetical protein